MGTPMLLFTKERRRSAVVEPVASQTMTVRMSAQLESAKEMALVCLMKRALLGAAEAYLQMMSPINPEIQSMSHLLMTLHDPETGFG